MWCCLVVLLVCSSVVWVLLCLFMFFSIEVMFMVVFSVSVLFGLWCCDVSLSVWW